MYKFQKRKFWVISICLIFLFISCDTVPVLPDKVAKDDYQSVIIALQKFIEKRIQKDKITGMCISLVNGDEVLWSQGFGYHDKEQQSAATADTPFYVGSISKLFTGTAIMQLVEQGKIDLDAPLTAYIPGFSIKSRFPNAPPITIRSLLTHHSGLPTDWLAGWWLSNPPPSDYKQRIFALPEILKDAYTYGPPDSFSAYSNLGYALLGVVVANVSGMDFDLYIKEHILQPLGMTHSTFMADEMENLVTKGYIKGKVQPMPYIRDYPAGSLVTSANDMTRFIKMILHEGEGVLNPDTFRVMATRQNVTVELDGNLPVGISYWLFTFGLPVEKTLFHDGGLPPFYANLIVIPEYKIAVFAAVNTEEGVALPSDVSIEAMRLMLEAKTGLKPEARPEPAPKRKWQATELAQMEGAYSSPVGYLDLKRKGSELGFKLDGTELFIIPRQDNIYTLEYRLLGFIPVKIPSLESLVLQKNIYSGKTVLSLISSGTFAGLLDKFEPVPVPDIWKARQGTYYVINPDEHSFVDNMILVYDKKKNYLIAKINVQGQILPILLIPESDNSAYCHGRGRNLGFTITVTKEGNDEIISTIGLKMKKK